MADRVVVGGAVTLWGWVSLPLDLARSRALGILGTRAMASIFGGSEYGAEVTAEPRMDVLERCLCHPGRVAREPVG